MNARVQRYLVYLGLIAILATGIWWLTRAEPVEVNVATVSRGQVESSVANTRAGTVNACRRAKLAPVIGGQIASLPVREGEQVEKDQILLELWNKDLAAQLLLAEHEARASRARAEQSCTVADVARRKATRLQKLNEQGLASVEDTDSAIGEARATSAACEAEKTMTRVNEARIEVARAVLERTQLRAPFDGTIAEINGELGEVVTPSPIGIPTLPAVDIIDRQCLYVTAPIDEVDAPAIRAGMPVRITLDAFSDEPFAGSVRRVAPYVLDVEKQARTVDIEVDFSDNGERLARLLPGYSADVEIILKTRDNVLRIPSEALLENNRVLVYRDGLLEEKQVSIGVANWRYSEITQGLAEDEQVVTSIDRKGVEAGVRARLAP
jgi:HlyD family secretion protein